MKNSTNHLLACLQLELALVQDEAVGVEVGCGGRFGHGQIERGGEAVLVLMVKNTKI